MTQLHKETGEPKKVEGSPEQNKKSEKWESGRANNGLKNDEDLWQARIESTINLRLSNWTRSDGRKEAPFN